MMFYPFLSAVTNDAVWGQLARFTLNFQHLLWQRETLSVFPRKSKYVDEDTLTAASRSAWRSISPIDDSIEHGSSALVNKCKEG